MIFFLKNLWFLHNLQHSYRVSGFGYGSEQRVKINKQVEIAILGCYMCTVSAHNF